MPKKQKCAVTPKTLAILKSITFDMDAALTRLAAYDYHDPFRKAVQKRLNAVRSAITKVEKQKGCGKE